MQIDVGKHEPYAKDDAYDECPMLRESVESLVPNPSHIEEEGSAKDVIQEEPHGIALLEEPVTDWRKEQYNPMKVANSLD